MGAKELYDQALREFREKKIDPAISHLEEAIAADRNFTDAYEALGLLYFRQKRIEDAIRVTRRLAEIAPDSIMAHANLSRFYVEKGWIEEAEQEQAEARRLSWKAELAAKKARGEAVGPEPTEEGARKALEQKIETYRKVIELDPRDVLGYFSLGTAYAEAKMFGPSREAFERAVEVNPEHSPSYLGWGQALEALGRTLDAIDVYKKGIPVADRRGDMVPLKKMETRLAKLQASQQ